MTPMTENDLQELQPLLRELADTTAQRLPPHVGVALFVFSKEEGPHQDIAYIGDGDRGEVVARLKRFVEHATH